MIKVLLRVVAAIVVLILMAVLIVWIHVDRVAATALTDSVERVAEVPCDVDRVRVSLLRGRAEVDDFVVSNPPQFSPEGLFTVANASMSLHLWSLFDRPIRLGEITVLAPTLRVEAGQRAPNVLIVLGNIARNTIGKDLGREAPDGEKPEREKAPTRMTFDRIRIEDATVTFDESFGDKARSINVASLELTEIRGKDGRGVTYGELTALIVMNLVREGAVEAGLEPGRFIPQTLPALLDKAAKAIRGIDEGLIEDIREGREEHGD